MGSFERTGNKYKYSKGTKLSFGKYEGQVIDDIIDTNPKYIQWCLENVKWFSLSKSLVQRLANALNAENPEYLEEDEAYENMQEWD